MQAQELPYELLTLAVYLTFRPLVADGADHLHGQGGKNEDTGTVQRMHGHEQVEKGPESLADDVHVVCTAKYEVVDGLNAVDLKGGWPRRA